MSGVYYAVWIVAILLLIRWFRENDGAEVSTGLFALGAPDDRSAAPPDDTPPA